MSKKRILLSAAYSLIEPLGLLHLAGLARDLGWDRMIHLIPDHDFDSFFEKIRDFRPDIVGFNIYTGNHLQSYQAFKKLRRDYPDVQIVVGGPHPTYFPVDSSEHADFVVMSEGFGGLRQIMTGNAKKGILAMEGSEKFPQPDRETFYRDYPEHAASRIKSIISMTGCPYKCTYCYNSSTPQDINVPPEIAEKLAQAMGYGGRLFPYNVRTIEDVIAEGREIAEKWPTDLIYFQDDVHGFDVQDWLPKFAPRWKDEVTLPYHAQMRWEMTRGDSGSQRLDVLKRAGCFGLTLAIEAADELIRKEVLDRGTSGDAMFEGMQKLTDREFKVRTEQITALPYGATSGPTPMNLEADLGLVELNVKLRESSGGPTMAWASTFVPYAGTKLGIYSQRFGHYSEWDNNDVPDTFFDRSVLRFPVEWVGQKLEDLKGQEGVWLDNKDLERYRSQNAELRRIFNFVTLIPDGHQLARIYIESSESYTFERLGQSAIKHLKERSDSNGEARRLLNQIKQFQIQVPLTTSDPEGQKVIKNLAGYFGCLPKGLLAAKRFAKYAQERGSYSPVVLSTATRHHLYDEVLYEVDDTASKEESDYLRSSMPETARISKV